MRKRRSATAVLVAMAVVAAAGIAAWVSDAWRAARNGPAAAAAAGPATTASSAALAGRVTMRGSTWKKTPAEPALARGNARMQAGDPAGAEQQYRAALQQDPDLAVLHSALGASQHLQKKLSEAGDSYRRALELDKTNLAAQVGLAGIAWESGRHEQAAALFEQALRQAPDEPVAVWGLAMSYQALRNPRAAETFRRYLAIAPPSERTAYAARQLGQR